MNRLIKLGVTTLILLSTLPANSETIIKRTSDEMFGVTSNYLIAKDTKGNSTTFRIEYFGHAKGKMWQEGHNSKPLEGHFIDNRKCYWDITGKLERKVVMESAIGAEGEYKPLGKIYEVKDVGDLGADDWFESLTYTRPCTGKEERDYEERFNKFKSDLVKKIPDIKNSERESLIKELKDAFKVSTVIAVESAD